MWKTLRGPRKNPHISCFEAFALLHYPNILCVDFSQFIPHPASRGREEVLDLWPSCPLLSQA